MCIEYAQLLSTAHYVLDGTQVGYKPTHKNHPCAIWVRQSVNNYNWLLALYMVLGNEYTKRYKKTHKSMELLNKLTRAPSNIPRTPHTLPPQCMPDDCKALDVVVAYRNYYNKHKQHIAKWKHGKVPNWFNIRLDNPIIKP